MNPFARSRSASTVNHNLLLRVPPRANQHGSKETAERAGQFRNYVAETLSSLS